MNKLDAIKIAQPQVIGDSPMLPGLHWIFFNCKTPTLRQGLMQSNDCIQLVAVVVTKYMYIFFWFVL